MENPTTMDDLGVPLFLETPIYGIILPCYIGIIVSHDNDIRIPIHVRVLTLAQWGVVFFCAEDQLEKHQLNRNSCPDPPNPAIFFAEKTFLSPGKAENWIS